MRGVGIFLLSLFGSAYSSFFELSISFFVDGLLSSFEHGLWCDISDGTVQSFGIVVDDELFNGSSGVFERQRRGRSNASGLDGAMIAFDFAIALGVVGACADMGHAADADELFEVFGNELGAVVGDDSWSSLGIFFSSGLNDGFNISFFHLFSDVPVHDAAAESIEDGGHEVEGTGDIQVRHIHVPMFVSEQGLLKSGTLLRGLRMSFEQSCLAEDSIDSAVTAGDDIGIDHHVSESSIPFERVFEVKFDDGLFFPFIEPMVAGDPAIVLIDSAIVTSPAREGGRPESDPLQEFLGRDAGFGGPFSHVVNDFVANLMGNPVAFQGSPLAFFSCTCSCSSSAMTSFFCCSFASRTSIFC